MAAIVIPKILSKKGVVNLVNSNGVAINTIDIDNYGRKQTAAEVKALMETLGLVFPSNALDLVAVRGTVNIKVLTLANGNYFGINGSGIMRAYYPDGTDSNLIDFNALSVINSNMAYAYFYIQYVESTHKYLMNKYTPIVWINKQGGLYTGECSIQSNVSDMTTFLGTTVVVPDDPFSLVPQDERPGGYASGDYSGDDVDIPALPTISAAASGFVRLYNPTIGEVQSLASYLWSGAFDLATYKKLFGNPMDCFLSFGIIPITPPRSVNKEAISFANMPDPGVTAYKLTSQFDEFDCGSITIDGSKYTASAMDYSPYTKAELFLPFCGTHSLAVDDIMDSTISIKYHMDLYTGACVAYVKIARTNSDGSTLDSVLYQFTGNILATIPLTGADHSNFIQSMLFMGAAAAATVATAGGAAPEIGGAMAVGDSVSTSALGGAAISASGINAVMSMKPNVIRSGNLSANAGFLGLKNPVITLTCPNLCRPEDENKLAGMPCQKSGTLSDFSGFNIVGACHLDNIPCTMEELRMIDTALAKGVIV